VLSVSAGGAIQQAIQSDRPYSFRAAPWQVWLWKRVWGSLDCIRCI